MPIDTTLLTFVHLTDTHIQPTADLNTNTAHPPANVRAMQAVAQINALPHPVDFVLHTGDVLHDPTVQQDYAAAAAIFAPLKAPIYYLSGNHDVADMLQTGLLGQKVNPLLPGQHFDLDYQGVQVIGLDSSLPRTPHGHIGAEQMAWFETVCRVDDPRPLLVAVHHHVLPIGVPWFDTMVIDDGVRLHDALVARRARLRGVFHGHIHQDFVTQRDGVTYQSARSTWYQVRTWHGQADMLRDDDPMPGFNLVTMTTRDTFVRSLRFTFDQADSA